jgi:RecB family exonuclease
MRISWSAAQMFRQCAKRYAYKHIDKIPEPPQPHFEHGNRVHSDIEHALKNVFKLNKPAFPPVRHVQWAVELVQECNPSNVLIEEWVNADIENIQIAGKADAILTTNQGEAIIDWKTSKKHPGQLKDDVRDQLHLYGAMRELGEQDRVVAAYPEHQVLFPVMYDPEHGRAVLDALVQTGHEIEEFKSIVSSAEEVQGNTQFLCQWCSYRHDCPDSYTKKER